MKKIILSFFIILLFVSFSNAQSFSLSVDDTVLGDTVTVYGDPDASGIDFTAIFNNNTDNNANIKVRRDQLSMVEGTTSYFKWSQPYAPTVDLSLAFIVNAGESTPENFFQAYYQPNGSIGISLIEFNFFNINVENEYVKIVVKFNTTSAEDIDENIIRNMTISDIYPNPAKDFITIDYDMPLEVETSSIRVINVLGSVVKEQELNTRDNKLKLDVSDLNDGIYFYTIFINNEPFRTEKLIVK